MERTEGIITHRVSEKTNVYPNEKASARGAEHVEYVPDSKKADLNVLERQDSDTSLSSDEKVYTRPPDTARDLVQEVLLVEDVGQHERR
jgi:hypothetical protein